jgi:hypothetical protein
VATNDDPMIHQLINAVKEFEADRSNSNHVNLSTHGTAATQRLMVDVSSMTLPSRM